MKSELTIIIRASTEDAIREIRKASKSTDRFGQQAEQSGKQAQRGYSAAAQGVRSISRQLEPAKKQLLAFVGIQQAIQASKALVGVITEYEKLNAQ